MSKEAVNIIVEMLESRGLSSIAIIALEMHRPLRGCTRELFRAFEPLARFLFGPELLKHLASLLDSDDEIERLITLLQGQSSVATGRAGSTKNHLA